MSPESGRRFGPYEIQSRLGGGGMGHVYKAWDARLHREVAIKLLHDEFSMPGMRERFLREARAASALNHPNICTIFDIGEQDGDPYLVMELLQGETLRDRIQDRAIKTDDLICIARETAEALGAAHAKGIIHRDVKPANIFLVDRENATVQAKVLDFGLAKIEGGVLGRGGRSLDITTAGATVGTLAYMSPEQARGETLDSRSDLFSLGVVLYEMATRHVPFQGATSALVFVKLLNHPPEPVRDWNEAIPRDLEKIIFKLMAKDRTGRYQTARELVDALTALTEKNSGGGWLRKAVATVPLVKAPDPVAREKRSPSKRNSESYQMSPPPSATLTPVENTPRPSSDAAQFLRPVARVPRGEPRSTPVPPLDSEAAVEPYQLATAPPGNLADPQSYVDPPKVPERAAAPLAAEKPDPQPSAPAQPTRKAKFTPAQMILGLVLLIFVVGAVLYFLRRGHFGPTTLTEQDAVVVTEIDNKTGDKLLDGTLAEALQLALQQSPYLRLRRRNSYQAALHQRAAEGADAGGPAAARDAAKRMNTVGYFIGQITGGGAPYSLHVELRNTASNDIMSSFDEPVSSLQELAGAVDRMAVDIRSGVGEDSDTISRAGNPLAHAATPNLEALHEYSLAEAALGFGKNFEALAHFRQATTLEPRFVLAQLKLASLYRRERAEKSAADAVQKALAAADGTGDRTTTLAQYEYEMEASRDYVRAQALIRHRLTDSPSDVEALEMLARTLRLQGHMSEALQAAQQAYAEDAYSAEAYTEAETALIALDRYDASYQLEVQRDQLGMSRAGGALPAAYLEHKQQALDAAVASLESYAGGYRSAWTYGIYLDNTGRLANGARLWRTRAQAAEKIPGLESAAAYLLAQGGLDRALIGDCLNGLAMAHESDALPQGLTTLFNTAMANALCGNPARTQQVLTQMQTAYPASFEVAGFYVPDLKAAIALQANDPSAALEALKPARQFDMISLTPLLRGRAHVMLRQTQIGIVDFQTVLAHRGVAFLFGGNVYPIAEIGVARAFADTGDLGNSAQAYRRFLELWENADPGQPLLAEAQAHVQQPAGTLPGK